MESRDIGAYDSCPSGCKYCYANKSSAKARACSNITIRIHPYCSDICLKRMLSLKARKKAF
ncbi:hypothetical protein ACTUM7_04480 [Basfia succiniciproducens]|uniref:hypothetical protein n=1 Tax=Basfia succiniciproducens TaxID=653940 RepID=UPI003FCC734C